MKEKRGKKCPNLKIFGSIRMFIVYNGVFSSKAPLNNFKGKEKHGLTAVPCVALFSGFSSG